MSSHFVAANVFVFWLEAFRSLLIKAMSWSLFSVAVSLSFRHDTLGHSFTMGHPILETQYICWSQVPLPPPEPASYLKSAPFRSLCPQTSSSFSLSCFRCLGDLRKPTGPLVYTIFSSFIIAAFIGNMICYFGVWTVIVTTAKRINVSARNNSQLKRCCTSKLCRWEYM